MCKDLPPCPVETTLSLIESRWTILILRDLLKGTMRFCELQRSLGKVSQKVLSSTLKNMEKNNLVKRSIYPEVPPRVEYTLTETGQSLRPLLEAMHTWGQNYKANINKQNNN